MRVGRNPKKEDPEKIVYKPHRLIIPVFIPDLEGFHKEALEVFKYCFKSIIESVDPEYTNISIIDNNSCIEVRNYLEGILKEGKIDRLIINYRNYGKVHPIISEARASSEEFITFSDADIYYLPGWVENMFRVFHLFPKAGAVATLVNPTLYKYCNDCCLIDNMIPFNRIKKGKVSDSKAIEINTGIFSEEHYGVKDERIPKEILDYQFYLQKDGYNVLIGCGHQSVTIRRDVLFSDIHKKVVYVFYEKMRLEYNNYDKYVDLNGFWRLSTSDNYAFHIGNKIQSIENNLKENTGNEIKEFISDNYKRSFYRLLPTGIRSFIAKLLTKIYNVRY